MTDEVPETILDIIKDLSGSTISEIGLNPHTRTLRIDLASSHAGEGISVEFYRFVQINISGQLDDEEDFPTVIDVFLSPLDDSRLEVLSALDHQWRETERAVSTYPGRPLYHLHLVGSLCIDVIAEGYQVFRAVSTDP
jgi:hypothetical protein